jgi:O-antigen ligase
MKSVPTLGLLQAATIMLVGLYAIAKRNLGTVACLVAYLIGAEVLWRQVKAPVPYQTAPYVMILLSAFVVVFAIGRLNSTARLAVLYFLLLIPSVINTIRTAGAEAREMIAFALSGPAALACFVAFTSQVRATPEQFRRILWAALISAVGPLAIALSEIQSELAKGNAIEFKDQSNFLTSGGFGPVQVSAVLGLGVVIAIVLTIFDTNRVARYLAGILALVFSVQSLLTFSRGGMFSAAIGLSALAIAQARNRRIRNRVMVVVAIALTLGYFVVVPFLTDFTGGAFEKRFTDTESARTDLASNDAQIFTDNILFGVGPGMTKYQRLTYEVCQLRSDKCDKEASSHTEFTRLLSEHGIPGVAAGIVLIWMAVRAIRGSRADRPFAVAFIFWAVAQMFYANLRVVAVPFAFGLAFLTVRAMDRDEPPNTDDTEPAEDDDPVRRSPVAAGAAYGADTVGLVTPARTSSPLPLRVPSRSSCVEGRHVALVTADELIVPEDQRSEPTSSPPPFRPGTVT